MSTTHTQVSCQDHKQGGNAEGGDTTLLKALPLSPDTIPINPACQSDPQLLKIGSQVLSDQTPPNMQLMAEPQYKLP